MCDNMVLAVSTLRNRRGRCAGAIVRAMICGGQQEHLHKWSERHPQATAKIASALSWHGYNGPLSTAPVLLGRVTEWENVLILLRELGRIEGIKVDVWPPALLLDRKN